MLFLYPATAFFQNLESGLPNMVIKPLCRNEIKWMP